MFFCETALPLASSVRRLRATETVRVALIPRMAALLDLLKRNCRVSMSMSWIWPIKCIGCVAVQGVSPPEAAGYQRGAAFEVEGRISQRDDTTKSPGPQRQHFEAHTSSRCLNELDRNTTELIFAFAATPAVREVFFRQGGFRSPRSDVFLV